VVITTAVAVLILCTLLCSLNPGHVLSDGLPSKRSKQNPINELEKFSATQSMLSVNAITAKQASKPKLPWAKITTSREEPPKTMVAVRTAATKRRYVELRTKDLTLPLAVFAQDNELFNEG
jgi:hypothetical protein